MLSGADARNKTRERQLPHDTVTSLCRSAEMKSPGGKPPGTKVLLDFCGSDYLAVKAQLP
jgi:hypothetical protein